MHAFIHPQAIERAQARIQQLKQELKNNPYIHLHLKIALLFGGSDTDTRQAAIYVLTGTTTPSNECSLSYTRQVILTHFTPHEKHPTSTQKQA